MDVLKNMLPAKIFEVIENAGINTSKQIIILSLWDIKKLTNLLDDEILLVKNIASNHYSPISITSDKLQDDMLKIKTGCNTIDNMLNGGFRKGVLSEIYGESGTGKTQIAMQSFVHCGDDGSIVICTEDLFPIKRFHQLCMNIRSTNNTLNGDNLFIEHLNESRDLMSCVRTRLPILLNKHRISLVVIDSVAAPFRCEYTNYVQRAEELRELGTLLIELAQKHNLAVICLNQVTASFNNSDDVLPTLGLVWSNMVSYRLKLTKHKKPIQCKSSEQYCNLRELTVTYAPDLQSGIHSKFIITANGVVGV